jgi:hypothetical protein
MPRNLIRAFAFLLIPCLVADPALASCPSPLSVRDNSPALSAHGRHLLTEALSARGESFANLDLNLHPTAGLDQNATAVLLKSRMSRRQFWGLAALGALAMAAAEPALGAIGVKRGSLTQDEQERFMRVWTTILNFMDPEDRDVLLRHETQAELEKIDPMFYYNQLKGNFQMPTYAQNPHSVTIQATFADGHSVRIIAIHPEAFTDDAHLTADLTHELSMLLDQLEGKISPEDSQNKAEAMGAKKALGILDRMLADPRLKESSPDFYEALKAQRQETYRIEQSWEQGAPVQQPHPVALEEAQTSSQDTQGTDFLPYVITASVALSAAVAGWIIFRRKNGGGKGGQAGPPSASGRKPKKGPPKGSSQGRAKPLKMLIAVLQMAMLFANLSLSVLMAGCGSKVLPISGGETSFCTLPSLPAGATIDTVFTVTNPEAGPNQCPTISVDILNSPAGTADNFSDPQIQDLESLLKILPPDMLLNVNWIDPISFDDQWISSFIDVDYVDSGFQMGTSNPYEGSPHDLYPYLSEWPISQLYFYDTISPALQNEWNDQITSNWPISDPFWDQDPGDWYASWLQTSSGSMQLAVGLYYGYYANRLQVILFTAAAFADPKTSTISFYEDYSSQTNPNPVPSVTQVPYVLNANELSFAGFQFNLVNGYIVSGLVAGYPGPITLPQPVPLPGTWLDLLNGKDQTAVHQGTSVPRERTFPSPPTPGSIPAEKLKKQIDDGAGSFMKSTPFSAEPARQQIQTHSPLLGAA